MKGMRYMVLLGLLAVCTLQAGAQIDPTLAGMVYLYTDKAEDQLKAQERAMLMQTTGHIWTREEVEGTTDIQRTFNDYLDSFRESSATPHRYTGSITKSAPCLRRWAA